jgi:hypothetical protein
MKKILAFAVILSLLIPAAAFAAAEFTLGGFVKLDSFWDSTQDGKNMNTPIQRANNGNFHHGRMKFTAQGSRFNLTIKGPKLWGATTTGYIEMDFDPNESPLLGGQTSSNSYTPRLRHAMFRFNWPTTELLFGQYWSMFCEFYPEPAQDGPLQGHGMPTARMAQVRVTQNFGSGFSVAGLIGEPNNINGTTGALNYGQSNSGENAETPQIQGKIQYAQDLWGKAAYYGRPMPFTARVIGGWQRNVFIAPGAFASNTFGQNAFNATAGASIGNHQYLSPWMIMGNLFIPVLPTHSANLAGTASVSLQGYVGQGLGAFGNNMGNDVFAHFSASVYNPNGQFATNAYDQQLYQQFGGYAQAQYYFTNHWFANVLYGFQKQFNVDRSRNAFLAFNAPGTQGNVWSGADQPNFWQEVDFTLWYRPITAIKFGLQYAWQKTNWVQVTSTGVVGNNTSDSGTASRVEFVGYFYF